MSHTDAVGGWRDMPVTDEGVQAAAAFAVRTSTRRENVKYTIIAAKAQVFYCCLIVIRIMHFSVMILTH
jgi:hypothetical protein